jgi:hypothetical protein
MKSRLAVAVAFSFLIVAQAIHAEDWTVKGKTYQNVHITQVNVDTVSVTYENGAGRFNLSDLTPEIQARLSEDVKKAKTLAYYESRAATDPIAHLVVTLDATHGLWTNGGWRGMPVAKCASPYELLARTTEINLTTFKIVRVDQVQIDGFMPDSLTYAVLVYTNATWKIGILHYEDKGGGWGIRVYDASL